MTITELAIRRPILIVVLFTALSLLGFIGYSQLKYESFPKINIPVVTIQTIYPGASASEIESSVTKKIEDAVSGLDKVDNIISTSAEGVSIVTISFLQDANIDISLQDAQRKVNQIISSLPTGVKSPALLKVSLDDMPILIIGVTGNLPDTQLYQFVKNTVAPRISKQPGVGQVRVIGGLEREIKVNIDTQKLKAYRLSSLQVLQAIQSSNLEFPTGAVKDQDKQFVVRMAGKFSSVDEIRQLIIARSGNGGDIRLSNIAEVQDGEKDPVVIGHINGKNTLTLMIQKQSDANAVDVTKRIKNELKKLEAENRQSGLKTTIAMDNTIFTLAAANAVKEDLAIAILLVAGVMLVFLHSLRNSIIVMVAIPTSLICAFIGMWMFGYSLNVITLLALSLVIGILVDDAIVVLENIYRHLEMGKDKKIAALEGRNEIGFTALSITMVDVVIYVPLALVSGIIGGMLREFSVVIVTTTLMSLFVSFTVTPLLASRFAKLESLTAGTMMGKFGRWFEAKFQRLALLYGNLLEWSLNHQGKILLLAAFLFISSLTLIPLGFIGSEFIPASDQDQIQIALEYAPGTKLEDTDFNAREIEKTIYKIPEVDTVFVASGISDTQRAAVNKAIIYINLIPKSERSRSTEDIRMILKKKLELIPGVTAHVTLPSIVSMMGVSAPVQFSISGSNWDTVAQTALRVKAIATEIPGAYDVRLSSELGQPEMKLQIDRNKMSDLGLSMADVGSTLQVGLAGNTDSKYKEPLDGNEYDINVMLDKFDRTKTTDLGGLTISNRQGQLVELNQIANILPDIGPTQLDRRDRNYAINLYAECSGRTSGDIGNDISKAIAKDKLPPGVTVAPIGTLKTQADSFSSLGLAFLIGIVFVYLIMAALYNSFLYPFTVLFSVPLALIGALLVLALTRNSLNILTILGIIMLIGLVSKNAILLVDFTNRAREAGQDMKEALKEAGRERLRPILMTTLTMILGMLPIAMASSSGAEFKNGMGWALIGGLTSSMLMTLVVVPVVYAKVEYLKEFFSSLIKNKSRSLTKL
jgi:HAE1 family hydrophobic/amphiphilic exporter-1